MRKSDAEKLIGKPVSCWTALNGCYIGELIEVYGSPWRGKVKILEVNSYPVQGLSEFAKGIKYRKPYKYGDIKDFGNSSIKPYDNPIRDYHLSLIETLKNDITQMETNIEISKQLNSNYGMLIPWLNEMKRMLQELNG